MKRRDAGEIDRWRVAVFVAVVALHVLVGLLLFATGTIRVGRPPAVEAPLALVWLSLKSPARLPVAAAASIPTHTPKRKEALPEIQRQPEAATFEPSNAITLPLDLSADADAAARREAQKEGKKDGGEISPDLRNRSCSGGEITLPGCAILIRAATRSARRGASSSPG